MKLMGMKEKSIKSLLSSKKFEKKVLELTQQLLTDSIICIDSHTGGEPTRLVVGGLPEICGDKIIEKTNFFAENFDYIRTTLTAEPRAHKPMHALMLCPPSSDDANFGLIISCALGYLDMCGHGLIGAVTSVLEAGIVHSTEPETKLIVETPAGDIEVFARISQSKVDSVVFRNQPAFVFERDLKVRIDSLGKFNVDVSYGGNWYVVVDAKKTGIEMNVKNLNKLRKASKLILEAVNDRIRVEHPLSRSVEKISQIVFMGPPKNPKANGMNLITSSELGFDRSPCGTGSSAKMAVLHSRGELNLNEDYVHESCVTGSLFSSRLVEKKKMGLFDAVVPEIEGSAYITGINHIIVDPRDPLRYGFYLE
jgi:proline racemase